MWSESPSRRLEAAKGLSAHDLRKIRADLMKGCPSNTWPYGCSTSINPWVVFLGPSPGASPAAGDSNYLIRAGSLPTAGEPPESMIYADGRGFFDRLRSLTYALINADAKQHMEQRETLSLSAMMNLDSGASGEASKVRIDPNFARWSIDVCIRRLHPKYVVGLGLAGMLSDGQYHWLREELETYIEGPFNLNQPPIKKLFHGYSQKQYWFRAWPLKTNSTMKQYLILFPQHPSRAPMTSSEIWTNAVHEFLEFSANQLL